MSKMTKKRKKWVEWEDNRGEWFGVVVSDFDWTSNVFNPYLWKWSREDKAYVGYRKLTRTEIHLARMLFTEIGYTGIEE